MKEFCVWYRAWDYIRTMLDVRFVSPLIAKISRNEATEEDLAPVHMASLPKNLPSEIRTSLADHLRRVINGGGQ
jgi:hypothetical protein